MTDRKEKNYYDKWKAKWRLKSELFILDNHFRSITDFINNGAE